MKIYKGSGVIVKDKTPLTLSAELLIMSENVFILSIVTLEAPTSISTFLLGSSFFGKYNF